MNPDDPNVVIVELVAKALGGLTERLVFVGGCAVGLLITDNARPPVRPTNDVDLIAEVTSRVAYYALTKELRAAGFVESGEIICRWRFGNLLVDVMPTDEAILGFSNRWYPAAIREAKTYHLPSGREIQLISAPLLVATKLEAFYGRGNGDFAVSHDIEDIINLIDGRPELLDEVAASESLLRNYLREEVDRLLAQRQFVDTIPWHMNPDQGSAGRESIVIGRLRAIAGI